jgi:hypothetical protein
VKNKKRLFAFLIFVGLFTISYYIGSQNEISEADALEFRDQFEELIEGIDGIGIFLHNATIAIVMFIPGFGVAWGFFSAWQTGQAFSALALLSPIISEIHPLALLYASPFGIMELVAYSIGMSRSLLLAHSMIKKIPIIKDYKIIGIEIGTVLGLLLVGGFLEAHLIEMIDEPLI